MDDSTRDVIILALATASIVLATAALFPSRARLTLLAWAVWFVSLIPVVRRL